tara:strand:- start:40 stop:351 length:312 start_codon:yes stop_codon:yes gene_type:complete
MRREKDIYHSRILNKTRKIIEDSKRFNKQVDFFINKIETQRSLPPLRINRGEIRKMNENQQKINKIRIKNKKQMDYENAKKKYEIEMHNIMEEIIKIKIYNKI